MNGSIASAIRRYVAPLVILAGVGIVGVGLLADMLGLGGGSGYGPKQLAVIGLGLSIAALGAFLRTARAERYLEEWRPPTLERERLTTLLALALAISALVGIAEVVLVLSGFGLTYFQRTMIQPSFQSVWVTPLGYAAPLMILVSLLALAASRFRWLGSLAVASFAVVFAGLQGLLNIYSPQLHSIAIWVLSLGIAWQVARLATRYPAGLRRLAQRAGLATAILLAIVALAIPPAGRLAENRAAAALPPPSPDAPNILLIILDTVRAQSLSLYGYERNTTPALDSLSQTGVVFDYAIATAPWTLPTHASVFTGLYPHDFEADWQAPLEEEHLTLAEALTEHGYRTGGFVANKPAAGPHTGLAQGFQRYDANSVSATEFIRSSGLLRMLARRQPLGRIARSITGFWDEFGRKHAPDVNREFLRWLSRTGDRPFFVFLNYYDAHHPYLPPEPYARMFESPGIERIVPQEVEKPATEVDPRHVQSWQDMYDGTIAYLDAHLRVLFHELEDRGQLDNTLVIITSDHGEEFGEHGVFTHASTLYLPVLQVPLIVWFPRKVPAGVRIPEPVTLRDIPATVLDLADLDHLSELPGTSLAAHWQSTRTEASIGERPAPAQPSRTLTEEDLVLAEARGRPWQAAHLPISRGDMLSLVYGPYHYIRNGDGQEELFDIVNDPWEEHDQAGEPDSNETLRRLRELTEPAVLRYSGAPRSPELTADRRAP